MMQGTIHMKGHCTEGGTRTHTGITAHWIFIPTTAFAASGQFWPGFVAWTIPSPYPNLNLGASHLVSTPSWKLNRLPGLARDCHSCFQEKVSPTLRGSTSLISPGALNLNLSPARLPVPPLRQLVNNFPSRIQNILLSHRISFTLTRGVLTTHTRLLRLWYFSNHPGICLDVMSIVAGPSVAPCFRV